MCHLLTWRASSDFGPWRNCSSMAHSRLASTSPPPVAQTWRRHASRSQSRSKTPGRDAPTPLGLYKIFCHLFLCCTRINHPFITPAHSHYPHYCNTIA